MDAETVAVVRQDPEKLTIQKLKSVLSAHGVTLPTTQQHKEFYVKEYRKLVESLLAAFGGSPASAIKTPTSPVVETKKRDRSRSPSPKPRLDMTEAPANPTATTAPTTAAAAGQEPKKGKKRKTEVLVIDEAPPTVSKVTSRRKRPRDDEAESKVEVEPMPKIDADEAATKKREVASNPFQQSSIAPTAGPAEVVVVTEPQPIVATPVVKEERSDLAPAPAPAPTQVSQPIVSAPMPTEIVFPRFVIPDSPPQRQQTQATRRDDVQIEQVVTSTSAQKPLRHRQTGPGPKEVPPQGSFTPPPEAHAPASALQPFMSPLRPLSIPEDSPLYRQANVIRFSLFLVFLILLAVGHCFVGWVIVYTPNPFSVASVRFCNTDGGSQVGCVPCPQFATCSDGRFTCIRAYLPYRLTCVEDVELDQYAASVAEEAERFLSRQRWLHQCNEVESFAVSEAALRDALVAAGFDDLTDESFAVAQTKFAALGIESHRGSVFQVMYSTQRVSPRWISSCGIKTLAESVYSWLLNYTFHFFFSVLAATVVAGLYAIRQMRLTDAAAAAMMSDTVRRILIERLVANQQSSKVTPSVGINQLRDTLVPPGERSRRRARQWSVAVQELESDSRVRKGTALISGVQEATFVWNGPVPSS